MKAFILDDDPITLALLAFMLEDQGVEVEYSTSCFEDDFYKRLNDFKPDIILLDLYLKDSYGLEVAKQIRKHDHLLNTPIIAISGSANDDEKLEALIGECIDYISKPFSLEQIKNAVEKYAPINKLMNLCDKILKTEEKNSELYSRTDKKE